MSQREEDGSRLRSEREYLAATCPRLASVDGVMSGTEKRRAARRLPAPGEPLRRVRSRTGHELDVVDVSHTGLLIEGRARLLPNTHLDLHLVTRTGRVLVRCRVVRAYVWYVEADLVRYRVALTFDQSVDTSGGHPTPTPFADMVPDTGTA